MVYQSALKNIEDALEPVKKIETQTIYEISKIHYERAPDGRYIENPSDPVFGYKIEKDDKGMPKITTSIIMADSVGTGSVIYNDGREVYVLTNHHVVHHGQLERYLKDRSGVPTKVIEEMYTPKSSKIKIEEAEFEVVASDKDLDVAIIKTDDKKAVQKSKSPAVSFGDGNDIEIGTRLYAVGHPFGLEKLLAEGISSGEGQKDRFTTTIPVNNGNSGGPIYAIKEDGEEFELVGIVASKLVVPVAIISPRNASGDPNGYSGLEGRLLEVPAAGISYGIRVDSIKGFLKKNNLLHLIGG